MPQNTSQWIYGIQDVPMSSYTDDGTPPTDMIKFVTSDRQAAEITTTAANNEGHATGTDWATESWPETHDVNIPFSIDPTSAMLRRLLNAGLGGLVNSQPDVGVELDTYTPQDADTSRQLPAYWMTEKLGSVHDASFPSCVLEALTFTGENSGRLKAAGNFRGSGQRIFDEDMTIAPETLKYYFKNSMSEVVRATAAVPATPVKTYACGLQGFTFDIQNNHNQAVGYDPGCGRYFTTGDEDSGIIRSHHEFGTRAYSGSFMIWVAASSTEYGLLTNQAELNIKMKMTGSQIGATGLYNELIFQMHLAKYNTVSLGEKEGNVLLEINPGAFYDESANKIVTITVQYPEVV